MPGRERRTGDATFRFALRHGLYIARGKVARCAASLVHAAPCGLRVGRRQRGRWRGVTYTRGLRPGLLSVAPAGALRGVMRGVCCSRCALRASALMPISASLRLAFGREEAARCSFVPGAYAPGYSLAAPAGAPR